MKTQITKQLSNAVTARTETSTKTRDRLSLFTLTLLALSLTFGAASATPAAAGVLDSSTVVQLSLPNCATNCGNSSPGIFPTINNTGGAFTGAWPSNVAAGWQGSFSGNGTYPVKEPGTNTFDFSGLGGANHDLPAGSLIFLGDLDAGSGGGESFSSRRSIQAAMPLPGCLGSIPHSMSRARIRRISLWVPCPNIAGTQQPGLTSLTATM